MVHVIRFLPLALTTFLSVSASHSRSRLVHKGLVKRVTGELLGDLKLPVFTGTRWTFYDAGLGACGTTNENRDYIVALNAMQFGVGFPGPQCFKKITMEYNGKKATATIVDVCPECPYGALDLSRGLFDFFAPEDEGVIYGQWYFGEDPRRGGDEENHHPPSPSKIKTKTKTNFLPSPTHSKVHTPNLPLDPVRKLPGGITHPTHASEPTRFPRPFNQSGNQQPASEKNANDLSPVLQIPPTSDTTVAARPNGKMIMSGPELPSNKFKAATPNAAMIFKGTPFKSEYVSEDKSKQSGNLVAFNMIFGRLGSIAAAASAAHRKE